MKFKRKTLFLLIYILSVISVATGVVYAAINSSIVFNNTLGASTDYFTIDNTGAHITNYYSTYDVYATDPSIIVTINKVDYDNDVSITHFDLLIFAVNATATVDSYTIDDEDYYSINDVYLGSQNEKGKCTVIKHIPFTAETTQNYNILFDNIDDYSERVDIVVLTYSNANRYITSLFDLQKSNNEDKHNVYYDAEGSMSNKTYYKNLFIISNFTITQDFTLNYPSYINLLYSTITLNANFTISHHERGLFEIEAITGRIDNRLYVFKIYSPNAYYSQSTSIDNIVYDSYNFEKTSDKVNFNFDFDKRTALLSDAVNYVKSCIPDQLFINAILPIEYHNYGVVYSYKMKTPDADDNGYATAFIPVEEKRAFDTQLFLLEITASYGEYSFTDIANLNIIGTSDEAFINGLAEAITNLGKKTASLFPMLDSQGEFIRDSDNNVMFEQKLSQQLELSKLIIEFINAFNYDKDFTLTVEDAKNLDIQFKNQRYRSVKFSYIDNQYKVKFGNNTNWEVLADSMFFVNPQTLLLIVDTESLTITNGVETSETFFNIDGITLKQQQEYLERYIETIYLYKLDDIVDLLRIDVANNSIFKGPTNEVIPYTLGFNYVQYKIYIINKDDITNLLEYGLTEQDRLDIFSQISSRDISSTFTFNAAQGTVTPKPDTVLKLDETEAIIIVSEFVHEIFNFNYTAFRQVVIPEGGIGGNDFTEYVKGNTFGPYFSSLIDGKLLNSTADIVGPPYVDGTAYKFTSGMPMVNLRMEIINASEVHEYCTLVSIGNFWQINIDINKVPSRNSIVELVAIFYTDDIDNPISTQTYTFIIPGVYRQGADEQFYSLALYQLLISLKDASNNYLYESYEGLLLVDGANAIVDTLNCSLASFNAHSIAIVGKLNIKGIELLTNTKNMIFDNCAIESLSPFGGFTTYELVSLSLNNCSITDTMLAGIEASIINRYLYTLNNLISINLDNNLISAVWYKDSSNSIQPLLYRTVTNLSINNNLFTELYGIETLPKITNLYLENNQIRSFEPIGGLKELKNVYLGNNIAIEFNNKTIPDASTVFYGTDGKINIPEYVKFIDRGINVYGNSRIKIEIGDGKKISQTEYETSLILNGIYIFNIQTNTIDFPSEVYETTNVTGQQGVRHDINVNYLLVNNNAIPQGSYTHINGIILTSLADGDTRIIFSIEINGISTYKEIKISIKNS